MKESKRQKIPMSRERAEEVVYKVKSVIGSNARLTVAGSYRRGEMIVNDLDFVAVLHNTVKDEEFFTLCEAHFGSPTLGGKAGDRKAQYVWENALLDFYLCEKDKLEPMLLFLTGSAKSNIRMRAVAKAKGMALNQYGLYDRKTKKPIGKQTEKGIFKSLELNYLKPEER